MKKQGTSFVGGLRRGAGFLLVGLVFQMGFGGVAFGHYCDLQKNRDSWACVLFDHIYRVEGDQPVERRSSQDLQKYISQVHFPLDRVRKELVTSTESARTVLGTRDGKKAFLQFAAASHCSDFRSKEMQHLCLGVSLAVKGDCGLNAWAKKDNKSLRPQPLDNSSFPNFSDKDENEVIAAFSRSACLCMLGYDPDARLAGLDENNFPVSSSFIKGCKESMPDRMAKLEALREKPCMPGTPLPIRAGSFLEDLNKIKDETIGFKREALLQSPGLLNAIVKELEKCEENEDGIHRKAGGSGQVDNALSGYDLKRRSLPPNLDCTVLSSLLKEVLKADPLVSPYLPERLADAMKRKSEGNSEILEVFRNDLNAKPEKKKELLNLLQHLARVESFSGKNLMTRNNLGIALGLVLFPVPDIKTVSNKNINIQEEIQKTKRREELLVWLIENRDQLGLEEGSPVARKNPLKKAKSDEDLSSVPTKFSPEGERKGKNQSVSGQGVQSGGNAQPPPLPPRKPRTGTQLGPRDLKNLPSDGSDVNGN